MSCCGWGVLNGVTAYAYVATGGYVLLNFRHERHVL